MSVPANKSSLVSAKRRERDLAKLRASGYEALVSEQKSTFEVPFNGPANTPYEGGVWKITLFLPEEYPYKSPSVGFQNKIFHPNVDFLYSGTVCLDVINQTWTPMYELVNVFQIFLPQLLTYPNPTSPLNHEAAKLFTDNYQKYVVKVKQCIQKFASVGGKKVEPPVSVETMQVQAEKPSTMPIQPDLSGDEDDDCSQLSSVSGKQKHPQLDDY